jgi:hypothetical protein
MKLQALVQDLIRSLGVSGQAVSAPAAFDTSATHGHPPRALTSFDSIGSLYNLDRVAATAVCWMSRQ